MMKQRFNMRRLSVFFMAIVGVSLACGCEYMRSSTPTEKRDLPWINKVAVIGFQPAMSQGEKPDMVRSPLSGATFMGEPVPSLVAMGMSGILFEKLVAEKRYGLVSPGQTRGVIGDLVSSDSEAGLAAIEVCRKVGKAFDADAVMIGYLFRWREREGTDYAVNQPASVAFDLYLIRPDDGAILWRGRYDKTQTSLSENLLDAKTFFQGGGRWMTAEKLALIGLEDLLAQMPGKPVESKEETNPKPKEGEAGN